METWDAIRSRRDVRDYTDEPVDRRHLERILEAGRRAPSSQNWQPWDFVVVTDREQLRELSMVWRGAAHAARSAATIALVIPIPADEEDSDSARYDLGQATMSMMVTAADLGIGSGHAAVADQRLARQVLDLPEDRICAYLVAIGYPGDRLLTPIKHPDRREFDSVVHWSRW